MNNIHPMLLSYLKKIAKPRKQLGGHAICPYLEQYMDRVMAVESQDPEQTILNFVSFRSFFHLEAVIIQGLEWDFDKIADFAEQMSKKYRGKDIEVLAMAPDSEQPPLPLEYNYHEPLLIIQTRSTLLEARRQLSKTTDYYTYFEQ